MKLPSVLSVPPEGVILMEPIVPLIDPVWVSLK
jgi:hypothetical protein